MFWPLECGPPIGRSSQEIQALPSRVRLSSPRLFCCRYPRTSNRFFSRLVLLRLTWLVDNTTLSRTGRAASNQERPAQIRWLLVDAENLAMSLDELPRPAIVEPTVLETWLLQPGKRPDDMWKNWMEAERKDGLGGSGDAILARVQQDQDGGGVWNLRWMPSS